MIRTLDRRFRLAVAALVMQILASSVAVTGSFGMS
jgi:hypothetical protein